MFLASLILTAVLSGRQLGVCQDGPGIQTVPALSLRPGDCGCWALAALAGAVKMCKALVVVNVAFPPTPSRA